MRRIKLTDTVTKDEKGNDVFKRNNSVVVYDTSGPYSDLKVEIDILSGLPRFREEWYNRRKDMVRSDSALSYRAKEGKIISQMYYAKRRIITPEMEYVAIRENQQIEALGLKSYITPDFVRKELASGRAVIPANINHPEAEPMIIGRKFLVKINTSLPMVQEKETSKEEMIDKTVWACKWGSDVLSVDKIGKDQEWYLRYSPIPVCTTPIYQALHKVDGRIENLDWPVYRETLIEQAALGVDLFVIHAALLRSYVDMTHTRLTGIVCGGGSIMADWMHYHRKENFLYTHFTEICEILKSYDITLVIGDGLRPGSIYDANDTAHFAELHTKGQLTRVAWEHLVQVIIDGPGHMPLNKIQENVKEQQYACQHAPYSTYGPVTTDIAPGYDHISSAIGAAQMAWQGASMIGCILPKEYLGTPGKEDIRKSIIGYKIAAHAADLAKGHPGVQARDNALSKARIENRLKDQCNLAIDPERAQLLGKK